MNISFRLLSKLFSLKLFKGLPSKFQAVRENMSNLFFYLSVFSYIYIRIVEVRVVSLFYTIPPNYCMYVIRKDNSNSNTPKQII